MFSSFQYEGRQIQVGIMEKKLRYLLVFICSIKICKSFQENNNVGELLGI